MKNDEIKIIKSKGELPPLTADDSIEILNKNRERVRTLSNLILSIDGLLFSSSFVILFFAIGNTGTRYPVIFMWIVFVGILFLFASMLSGLFAALIPSPQTSKNKLELMDQYLRIYHKEFRIIRVSVVSLVISVILFIAALSLLMASIF